MSSWCSLRYQRHPELSDEETLLVCVTRQDTYFDGQDCRLFSFLLLTLILPRRLEGNDFYLEVIFQLIPSLYSLNIDLPRINLLRIQGKMFGYPRHLAPKFGQRPKLTKPLKHDTIHHEQLRVILKSK